MNMLYLSLAVVSCYANDNSAFVPEIWANEGLVILEENMVMANLVHRDFENEIRDFGDVVNTRRPGTFNINRKVDGGTLVNQNASATNVQVPLNQWFYASFTINDGEASKSFQDLVDIYLLPGMQTIARSVDRAILGRIPAYFGGPSSRAGGLNTLNSTNSQNYILDARQILNINKAYPTNRHLVLSPASESAMLKNQLFVAAQQRGDGGSALENAALGKILGFDTYMDQNVSYISGNVDQTTGVVTSAQAAGYAGSNAVTGVTGAWATGEFAVIVGNDQPTFISAHTETTGNTTAFTLNEGLKNAIPASSQVIRYTACVVQTGQAAGWSNAVTLSGFTNVPQVGQLLAFGTGGTRATYTIIESQPNANNGAYQDVYLDRPLDNTIATSDPAFPGPTGSFNWAFHREAVALVTRPLALPNNRMGVMADVAVHNDISMRVTMQYNIALGGTVVNLDLLAGVAVLDTRLAVCLLG